MKRSPAYQFYDTDEDPNDWDDYPECDYCEDDPMGVPTADYESYYGAMYKQCPKCCGGGDGRKL